MKLIPHSHFGMTGSIQKHTLVYTIVLGIFLVVLFDLSRIAALGMIYYLVVDMAIHWGILRHLRTKVGKFPSARNLEDRSPFLTSTTGLVIRV